MPRSPSTTVPTPSTCNIFAKLSELINEVKPDEMNVALAAVDKAIGGRGEQLGMMIDDWWSASQELEQTINRFIDATPEFARVTESLRRATPAMMETLASVASISHGVVDQADQLAEFFTSASGYLETITPFVATNRKNLITIIDSTGTILSTVAQNPSGITRTVREASGFGRAGTILFASGRFNITAVASANRPGVIDGSAEVSTLRGLEGVVTGGRDYSSGGRPNPATTMMLGPMVRGAEVRIK